MVSVAPFGTVFWNGSEKRLLTLNSLKGWTRGDKMGEWRVSYHCQNIKSKLRTGIVENFERMNEMAWVQNRLSAWLKDWMDEYKYVCENLKVPWNGNWEASPLITESHLALHVLFCELLCSYIMYAVISFFFMFSSFSCLLCHIPLHLENFQMVWHNLNVKKFQDVFP